MEARRSRCEPFRAIPVLTGLGALQYIQDTFHELYCGGDFLKIGLCIVCLIALFAVSGCGGSATSKTTLIQSDTDASWSMIGFGREWGKKFNSLGSLTLSASGEVTGGGAREFGVDKKRFTGGNIIISDQGSLSGFIDAYLADSSTTEKYTIIDGQITTERDIAVFEGTFPTARSGIVILISKNKTFTQTDLAGSWIVLHDMVYALNIDKEGTVTGCTLAIEDWPRKGMCEGTFSLDPSGAVSASMFFSVAKRAAVTVSGQLNAGKNFMVLAGSDSTNFQGTTLPFMKKEGAFSAADLEGFWRFSMTGKSGTFFGMIRLDKLGHVLEGTWSRIGDSANDTGTLERGKLFLTENGEIAGFFTISSGITFEILGGQIGPKKDIMDALYHDGTRTQGVMLFIRIS